MSLEVRVPTELTEYKEKIIFGLSLRQLAFTVLALVVGGLSFWLLYKPLGVDNASNILILITAPIFAFGFLKFKGYSLEKYLLIVYKHQFSTQKRPYKIELLEEQIYSNQEGTKNGTKKSNESRQSEVIFSIKSTAKERKAKRKLACSKISQAKHYKNRT